MNFKEKVDYFFNVKAAPKLEKFTKHRITKAIMTGMSAPIVMTIIGSIFIILKTPPIDPDTTNVFFKSWLDWSNANAGLLDFGNLITMKFIAIYALVGIAISLASSHKVRPINMVIISLACYIMLASDIIEGGISTKWFGASGLFPAAIIGIIVVELAVFLLKKGIKIKLPSTVPPNVAEPLENMFMNALLFALTMCVHEIFANFGTSFPEVINSLFQPLFVASDTVWAVILYTLLVRLLWFFGIHGGSVSSAVVTPFITNNMLLNINAYAEGKPLPCIFTIEFQHIWTVMGILSLCITLLIFAKSAQLKTISKVGLVPAFFTIGEPITFGVPTVLNFKLFIPYMTVFLINGIIPFYLTKWGFLAKTFVQLPDITPGIIGSFLNTMDWRAPIIYIGLIILNIVIWAPFVKSYDNDLLKVEQGN